MQTSHQNRRKTELVGALMLASAALVWGCAFVAQSIGAGYVGAFTFLAVRSWIAFFIMLPVEKIFRMLGKTKNIKADAKGENRKTLALGGLICGFFLFAGSAAQQIGIAHTTTAKCGFISAMYVVIVPVIYALFGRGVGLKTWVSVLLSVCGLYLLCMKEQLMLQFGDSVTLLCALLFSVQILAVNHFVKRTDGIRLVAAQFLAEAVFATIGMLLWEQTTWTALAAAMPTILYAAVMSSGVGYSMQTLGQEKLNPAIASIIMSLESVFSALAGWMVLHQTLTLREGLGCAVMLFATILVQIPIEKAMIYRKKDTA